MKRICTYSTLPNEALAVRMAVFVEEQGFVDEVDDTDQIATHLVLFEDDAPIGTCRIFPAAEPKRYILGRLAIMKAYRGQRCGSLLIEAAEEYVRGAGGTALSLHSQCRAQDFYKKCGYTAYGDIEDDEGCPHIWMKKEWNA